MIKSSVLHCKSISKELSPPSGEHTVPLVFFFCDQLFDTACCCHGLWPSFRRVLWPVKSITRMSQLGVVLDLLFTLAHVHVKAGRLEVAVGKAKTICTFRTELNSDLPDLGKLQLAMRNVVAIVPAEDIPIEISLRYLGWHVKLVVEALVTEFSEEAARVSVRMLSPLLEHGGGFDVAAPKLGLLGMSLENKLNLAEKAFITNCLVPLFQKGSRQCRGPCFHRKFDRSRVFAEAHGHGRCSRPDDQHTRRVQRLAYMFCLGRRRAFI